MGQPRPPFDEEKKIKHLGVKVLPFEGTFLRRRFENISSLVPTSTLPPWKLGLCGHGSLPPPPPLYVDFVGEELNDHQGTPLGHGMNAYQDKAYVIFFCALVWFFLCIRINCCAIYKHDM